MNVKNVMKIFGNIFIVTVTAIAFFLHHNKTSMYGREGFRETYNPLPPSFNFEDPKHSIWGYKN